MEEGAPEPDPGLNKPLCDTLLLCPQTLGASQTANTQLAEPIPEFLIHSVWHRANEL